MMDRCDLAWAAGFFDAEGTVSGSRKHPIAAIANTDKLLLMRFRDTINIGALGGPYLRNTADFQRSPQWRWQVQRPNQVERVLAMLAPWLSDPKKLRGAEVLEQPGVFGHSRTLVLRREDLAWAAGFFDGEGCFSHSKRSSMVAQITNSDPDILRRFQLLIGQGKIYGPYRYETTFGNNKERWVYASTGNENVQHVLGSLWFRLGRAKREKARSILLRYRNLYACGHLRERDRPWHKHCPRCFKPGPKPKSRSTR